MSHKRYPYKLEELVAAVVSSPAGLHVGFSDLSIYRLEDGRYAVNFTSKVTSSVVDGHIVREPRHKNFERLFDAPLEAAKFFEGKRLSMELGYDCEVLPAEYDKFIRAQEMKQHKPKSR